MPENINHSSSKSKRRNRPGGHQVFQEALPLYRYIYFTTVLEDFPADTFFPAFDRNNFITLYSPVKGRWVVERSISWTNRAAIRHFRRLVKDYKQTVTSSEVWLILANIQIMLQRINPITQT